MRQIDHYFVLFSIPLISICEEEFNWDFLEDFEDSEEDSIIVASLNQEADFWSQFVADGLYFQNFSDPLNYCRLFNRKDYNDNDFNTVN